MRESMPCSPAFCALAPLPASHWPRTCNSCCLPPRAACRWQQHYRKPAATQPNARTSADDGKRRAQKLALEQQQQAGTALTTCHTCLSLHREMGCLCSCSTTVASSVISAPPAANELSMFSPALAQAKRRNYKRALIAQACDKRRRLATRRALARRCARSVAASAPRLWRHLFSAHTSIACHLGLNVRATGCGLPLMAASQHNWSLSPLPHRAALAGL